MASAVTGTFYTLFVSQTLTVGTHITHRTLTGSSRWISRSSGTYFTSSTVEAFTLGTIGSAVGLEAVAPPFVNNGRAQAKGGHTVWDGRATLGTLVFYWFVTVPTLFAQGSRIISSAFAWKPIAPRTVRTTSFVLTRAGSTMGSTPGWFALTLTIDARASGFYGRIEYRRAVYWFRTGGGGRGG